MTDETVHHVCPVTTMVKDKLHVTIGPQNMTGQSSNFVSYVNTVLPDTLYIIMVNHNMTHHTELI